MPDPATTGKVIFVTTIPNSPAAKGGILPGDMTLRVDDLDVEGATPEGVAAKCRGDYGTPLRLSIRHRPNDEYKTENRGGGSIPAVVTTIVVER
jgi:C-terminal processing protease CtpA/Prc